MVKVFYEFLCLCISLHILMKNKLIFVFHIYILKYNSFLTLLIIISTNYSLIENNKFLVEKTFSKASDVAIVLSI